jgi:predicted acyltransferase
MGQILAQAARRFWESPQMLHSSSQGMATTQPPRITSIDALRGFVMFMMIFVNDLSGAGKIVPDWRVHFSDRHRDGSGMTFVDLVFPAFLFIVGMSVPLALGGRMAKGQGVWKTLGHVAFRTIALLFIGILMVHETPDTAALTPAQREDRGQRKRTSPLTSQRG